MGNEKLVEELERLDFLINRAEKASLMQKIGPAMSAVRVAYKVLYELVRREVMRNVEAK